MINWCEFKLIEYLKTSPNNKTIIRGVLNRKWSDLDNICYGLYELNNAQKELISAVGRTVNRIDLLSGV